jgi:hypothetical protein
MNAHLYAVRPRHVEVLPFVQVQPALAAVREAAATRAGNAAKHLVLVCVVHLDTGIKHAGEQALSASLGSDVAARRASLDFGHCWPFLIKTVCWKHQKTMQACQTQTYGDKPCLSRSQLSKKCRLAWRLRGICVYTTSCLACGRYLDSYVTGPHQDAAVPRHCPDGTLALVQHRVTAP